MGSFRYVPSAPPICVHGSSFSDASCSLTRSSPDYRERAFCLDQLREPFPRPQSSPIRGHPAPLMRRHFPPDAPSTPRTTTSSTPPDSAREHILLRLLQDLLDFFGPPASSTTTTSTTSSTALTPSGPFLLREGCGAAAPRCHPYTPWADPTSRLSQYPCCFRPAALRPCTAIFRPDPVESSRASCVGRRWFHLIRLSLGSCKLATKYRSIHYHLWQPQAHSHK